MLAYLQSKTFLFRQVLAFALWTYIFTKLFIFDVDYYALQNAPLIWILHYKLFILLGVLAASLLFLKPSPFFFFALTLASTR